MIDTPEILDKQYRIHMEDGSVWAVPVAEIALHRATHYLSEYEGDLIVSLYYNTLPLFEKDINVIGNWAHSNMTWEEVRPSAVMIKSPRLSKQYRHDWCVGEWEIV